MEHKIYEYIYGAIESTIGSNDIELITNTVIDAVFSNPNTIIHYLAELDQESRLPIQVYEISTIESIRDQDTDNVFKYMSDYKLRNLFELYSQSEYSASWAALVDHSHFIQWYGNMVI